MDKNDNLFPSKTRPKGKKQGLDEIKLVDDRRFSEKLEGLILEAEEMRLKRMRQHRTRSFLAITFSIVAAFIGMSASGWFFLMQFDVKRASICAVAPIILSIFVYMWAAMPIRVYRREHKSIFMPKLAKALGGFSYYRQRGLNKKILDRALVLPPHARFQSEDCFMGSYKGSKVIFSEARLYESNKKEPVFEGIFVLLETPAEVIEGHTIITANARLVQTGLKTTWKNMKRVYISPSNPQWDIFQIYATKPESAELIVGDRLLKELFEASAVFRNAPLTAVLFGRRFMFIMIPNDADMFEASSLFVPIATHQYALDCKKEIGQILEIIDIFDLYKPVNH